MSGRSLLGGAFVFLIAVGCSGESSVTTGATGATVATGATTSATPSLSSAPTLTDGPAPTEPASPATPASPTTVASPATSVAGDSTPLPSLPPTATEPSWAFAVTFALGSGRIDIVGASGEVVHSIETDDAAILRDPIQTIVRGRVAATALTGESELLVLDAEAGKISRVALDVPDDAKVIAVGYPRASHVLVMWSSFGPVRFPNNVDRTLSVDLTTLAVTDLRALLKIAPDERFYEVQRTQRSAEQVGLLGYRRSSAAAESFTLLFDIGSPESAQRVVGIVNDQTDDLLLTITSVAGSGTPASTLRLLDRNLEEQWRLEVKALVSGSILDDHRLVVSDGTDVVVIDVVTGEVDLIFSDVDVFGGRWAADRSVLLQHTSTTLVFLDSQGREIARFEGRPGLYSPFDDPDLVGCVVLGPVAGTGFGVQPTAQDELPMLLVALPDGRVLHEYVNPPTRFSVDACTTGGGDALVPGELVVRGAVLELAEGEIPLAISPDGTAALIADGLGGPVVIRHLDGTSPDTPLANPAGVGFFVEG